MKIMTLHAANGETVTVTGLSEVEIDTLESLMHNLMYPDPPDDGDLLRHQIRTLAEITGNETEFEEWLREVE